mgnify:CR=1 FL=1
MIDVPEEQLQEEYTLDLMKNGHLLYMASGGYGKTMLLTQIILGLSMNACGRTAEIPVEQLALSQLIDEVNAIVLLLLLGLRSPIGCAAPGGLKQFGKVEEPLPHLFLISDEFAELKKEQPDFMSELVSAARIGRSLGIHLILATQKPSGVVDDQIWTNSKFRLCLKVQNAGDSKEMLKTPDAGAASQRDWPCRRPYSQSGESPPHGDENTGGHHLL